MSASREQRSQTSRGAGFHGAMNYEKQHGVVEGLGAPVPGKINRIFKAYDEEAGEMS